MLALLQLSLSVLQSIGGANIEAWDRSLQANVHPGAQLGIALNIVSYSSLAADADFSAFISSLATVNFTSLSRNQSFALGINAYNAFAAKTLIDFACKYEDNRAQTGSCLGPAYGLPDVTFANTSTTAFTEKLHNFGGTFYSLNDIEGMMRPKPSGPLFRKPVDTTEDLRIHACLVCDGTSCPDLGLRAFTAEAIDNQMDAAARGCHPRSTTLGSACVDDLYLSRACTCPLTHASWFGPRCAKAGWPTRGKGCGLSQLVVSSRLARSSFGSRSNFGSMEVLLASTVRICPRRHLPSLTVAHTTKSSTSLISGTRMGRYHAHVGHL